MNLISKIISTGIMWLVFWSIFWLIWDKVVLRYFKWRNSNLKDNQKYSDEQFNELLNSKFSIFEKIKYNSIIVLIIGGSFVGFPFLFSLLLLDLVKNYLLSADIIFSKFTLLLPFSFLVGFIISIFIINISMNLMGYFSSRFNSFVSKNRAIVTNLREIEDKNKKLIDINSSFKALIILISISIPIIFLSLNSHIYITSEGLTTNSLFSFNEKTYTWNQISKVKTGALYTISNGGTDNFDFSYKIITKDNNEFEIWIYDYKAIEKVNNLIISKNIPIIKVEKNQIVINAINSNFQNDHNFLVKTLIKN